MKKLYFLSFLFSLITAMSFGQVIFAEDFTYPDGSLVPNGGWIQNGGAAGDFLVASGMAVVQHGVPSEDVRKTFTAVAGDVYAGFDFSVDDLGAVYAGADNEYFAHFGFKARMDVQPPTGAGDYTVGISSSSSVAEATWSTDLTFGTMYRAIIKFDQVTGTAQLWIDPAVSTDTSVMGTATGAATLTSFDLRQSDSTPNETVRVDNLMVGQTFADVLTFVAQTTPEVFIGSPANNTVFAPGTTNVDVVFSTANVTTETVDITVNGSTTTNATSPFSIATMDGVTYNVTVDLVDAGGVVSTKTTSFSVASITQVTDLAALRAAYVTSGNDSTIFYELMSTPTITYTRTSRNQKYCQDASAGILIDDSPGNITTAFAEGDGISGLIGTVSEYNAVMQFRPSQDAAVVAGSVVTPEIVTIAQIVANSENYESELVKIVGANFTDAGATFAVSTVYPINDPSARGVLATMDFRTNFSEANYIGTVIPTGNVDLTVFVAEFNGTPQVVSRGSTDILGVTKNEIEGFSMYPNPVVNGEITINTLSFSDKTVQVYDLLGKQVVSKKISGTNNIVSLENLNTGIYILKLEEEGKVAVRKLVIK